MVLVFGTVWIVRVDTVAAALRTHAYIDTFFGKTYRSIDQHQIDRDPNLLHQKAKRLTLTVIFFLIAIVSTIVATRIPRSRRISPRDDEQFECRVARCRRPKTYSPRPKGLRTLATSGRTRASG
jgi:hypothetical protein